MKRTFYIFGIAALLSACSSPKTYENDIFPSGAWHPVNPDGLNKVEVQKIYNNKT